MANNKLYGYTPKNKKPSSDKGKAYAGLEKGKTYENLGNRLDRVNPYEFRKGMDYQFERGMNQAGPINETSFKKYLESYTSERGDGMVEVDKEIKDDKMVELKEAIKAEIKNILSENNTTILPEEDDKDEKKASKKAKKSSKGMKALDKEEEKLRDQKKKLQDKIFPLIQDFKNKKIDKEKYEKKVGDIPNQIKDINKRLGEIDKEKEAIVLKEKEDRRAVAETAMDREVHMELLNIIKEQGISLREGSDSIRPYYEIAKIAYMEGLTAGLRGE